LISIVLVVATQAKGSVLIHQKMFESRLFFVDKLIDMGAQIILCDPHRANVIGLDRKQALRGIKMASPDIRAGVALLIAALSAMARVKFQALIRLIVGIRILIHGCGSWVRRLREFKSQPSTQQDNDPIQDTRYRLRHW
jgi:UDP-N-acetylglucosamine enolpyruvyl transferase